MVTAPRGLTLWNDPFLRVRRAADAKLAAIDPAAVSSVAVIKHAALGDLVLTRPFLLETRRHFPSARIVLGLASNYRRGAPLDLVDSVHVVERGLPWRRALRNYRELGTHDVLFDLTGTARSRWLVLLNRPDLAVGLAGSRLDGRLYDVVVPRGGFKYEAETFLDLLQAVGLPVGWPPEFALPLPPRPQAAPYVLHFVTASTPGKSWPADRFAQLARALAVARPGQTQVLLAGIADWEQAVAVRLRADLAGVPGLVVLPREAELEAWCAHATVCVANDTGARNLAIAFGTPTVGVFFDTPPFRYLPRFGRHEAVFAPCRALPEVADVAAAVLRLVPA
ncbi:MAG: glycosyltransferase family 9 protein [bacterium]|nr:glycosyltransferase family 9 protein [bacterium]